MDSLQQDLRYAFRGLLRSRGFTIVSLLTLGLGTGVNATVFSFVNALLLSPAPVVSEPARLVSIYTSDFSSGPYGVTSYPDYASLREETDAFESLAAYVDTGVSVLTVGSTIERVRGAAASGEFFATLGLQAAAGRLLSASDTAAAAPAVAVIGYDLWQRAFGGTLEILGATVRISGQPFTVVGVTPRGFFALDLGRAYDVWLPQPPVTDAAARGNRTFAVIGRLRAGVSLEQAQAQVTAVAQRLATQYPETNRGTLQQPDDPRPMIVMRHTRLHPSFRPEVTMFSIVIMSAVALVLLIACANVGALLLSRATTRTREMAVRLALGAGPRRLLRQLLVESALLGALGGLAGLLLALWTADLLPSLLLPELARILDARIDVRVLSFTAAVAFASSLLFGVAPALQAVRPASTALRADAVRAGESRPGLRLRRTLVVSQVALAFVLLVSASILTRSLATALAADIGFTTREAVIGTLDFPDSLAVGEAQAYSIRLLERLTGIPGVQAAALTWSLPLSGGPRRGFDPEGYQRRPGEGREQSFNLVTPEYFRTLGIPLVQGRLFDDRDDASRGRVAIVNQVMSDRYFGGKAVGRTIRDSRGTTLRVVGVVAAGPPRSPHEAAVPIVYYPVLQEWRTGARLSLIARTTSDASTLVETVRREALAVDSRVPIFRVMTLEALLAEAFATDRLTATLVTTSAALALVLAVVGVYGVVAFAVARRTREIGVRLALGATSRDVVRLILSEGLTVTLLGVLAGAVASLGAARALKTVMAGVGDADLATFVAVPLLLVAAALLAAWMPARRALALEPNLVLREE
jgi:putative ABC transport system permease protein